MKPGEHVFDALLLRVVDYGEKDRIVTFLGRGVGKGTVFARAARASRKRFPGGLELFTWYAMTVNQRSEGMGTLKSAATVRHLSLTDSIEHVAIASCGLELVRELIQEGEAQDTVLDGLWYFFEQLDHIGDHMPRLLLALRWLEIQLLATQGQGLELGVCLRCGGSLEPDHVLFSSRAGGLLHSECARPEDHATPMASRLVAGLRRLLTRPLAEILDGAAARAGADGDAPLLNFVTVTGRLLRARIEDATTSVLKSYAFLDALPHD